MAAEVSRGLNEAERKRVYRITIDKVHYELSRPEITGSGLLELAGKVPVTQYGIYIKRKGAQPDRVQLDQQVDLREPGVEHFVTLPLDQTEG